MDLVNIAVPKTALQEAQQYISQRESIVAQSKLTIANLQNEVNHLPNLSIVRKGVIEQMKPRLYQELDKIYKLPAKANCYVFDQMLTETENEIPRLAREKLANPTQPFNNEISIYLRTKKTFLLNELAKYNCKFEFEKAKLNENAGILGDEFTKTDKDVLTKAKKDQNILLIGGAGVLLVALFIILRKK